MSKKVKQKIEKILIFGLIIPVLGIVLSYYIGFNGLYDDLSDLGAINPLFNLGLIISGLVLGFFAKTTLTKIRVGFMARLLVMAASISLILTGLVHNNDNYAVHGLFAAIFFLALANAQGMLGKIILKKHYDLGFFSISVAIADYTIGGIFLIFRLFNNHLGYALPELAYILITLVGTFIFISKFKK